MRGVWRGVWVSGGGLLEKRGRGGRDEGHGGEDADVDPFLALCPVEWVGGVVGAVEVDYVGVL